MSPPRPAADPGAPPRAQGRGGVPSLSLQRPAPRPLLAGRRCRQHTRVAASTFVCLGPTRQRRRREVDRRRHRRAWRPSRHHRLCLGLTRSAMPSMRHGRSSASPGRSRVGNRRAERHRSTRPRRRGVCSPWDVRSEVRPRRLTFGHADHGIARRSSWSLRFHPACYYRETDASKPQTLPALGRDHGRPWHHHGLQRTWLAPEQPTKAPIGDPRRSLGHQLGGGVRLPV